MIKSTVNHLQVIVEHLKKKLIVDSLTEDGGTKFMGICKATRAGLGRRIDIRLIPEVEVLPCYILLVLGILIR